MADITPLEKHSQKGLPDHLLSSPLISSHFLYITHFKTSSKYLYIEPINLHLNEA